MKQAVPTSSMTSDSDAILSGVPSIVNFYEDYLDNIDKNIEEAINKVIPNYERKLRRHARRRGWDAESRKSISVSYDPVNLELSITGDVSSEYGTPNQPPAPVLRHAAANVADMERMFNKQIAKGLL
jgi:hypothetical protein